MARKKDMEYFDRFVSLVNYSCEAASFLEAIVEKYDQQKLDEQIRELHAIEHQADIEKHLMMQKLAKEFITPIEREDIMSLAHEIDNVTDAIEDVAMQLYMFNIKSVREEAVKMTKLIIRCCETLKQALQEFHNFRKSQELHGMIIEINRLEEDGDRMYTEAVHRLFREEGSAVEMMCWSRIYDRLERCCDVCENVAGVIESVIMKNS